MGGRLVFVASARFEKGAGDSVGDILYLPMHSFIFQEIMSTKQKKKEHPVCPISESWGSLISLLIWYLAWELYHLL